MADAPVCSSRFSFTHVVDENEDVSLLCQVTANPENVVFRWTFKTSVKLRHFPDDMAVTNSISSNLTFNVIENGEVLCTASNEVGTQKAPCVFRIMKAGNTASYSHDFVLGKSKFMDLLTIHQGQFG